MANKYFTENKRVSSPYKGRIRSNRW